MKNKTFLAVYILSILFNSHVFASSACNDFLNAGDLIEGRILPSNFSITLEPMTYEFSTTSSAVVNMPGSDLEHNFSLPSNAFNEYSLISGGGVGSVQNEMVVLALDGSASPLRIKFFKNRYSLSIRNIEAIGNTHAFVTFYNSGALVELATGKIESQFTSTIPGVEGAKITLRSPGNYSVITQNGGIKLYNIKDDSPDAVITTSKLLNPISIGSENAKLITFNNDWIAVSSRIDRSRSRVELYDHDGIKLHSFDIPTRLVYSVALNEKHIYLIAPNEFDVPTLHIIERRSQYLILSLSNFPANKQFTVSPTGTIAAGNFIINAFDANALAKKISGNL